MAAKTAPRAKPTTAAPKRKRKPRTAIDYAKRANNIKALRLLIDNHTSGKCSVCGLKQEDATRAAFHFHHLVPAEKLFSIGEIWSIFKDTDLTIAWKKTLKELNKTVLVCALCHARIHYNMRAEAKLAKAVKGDNND